MPSFVSASRAIRLSLIAAVTVMLTGASAWGQGAAPQLLPYTVSKLAGTGTTASVVSCPTKTPAGATLTPTDTMGDGCLAVDAMLTKPRYVTEDHNGNIFISDNAANVIRRIDATTGIITTVAGGGTGTYVSGTSVSTAVKLTGPVGLAFSPVTGDLYFGESPGALIRKISATGGLVTGPGVLTTVLGNGTFGYSANTPAVSGFTDGPYGIAFDANGTLYIAEEFKNAIQAINLGSSTITVAGVSIAPGVIAKLAGNTTTPATVPDCPTGTVTPFGCAFGTWPGGIAGNLSQTDSPYDITVAPNGSIYFANEFINSVGYIASNNILTTYAGAQSSTPGRSALRSTAGSFAIGSDFGVSADSNNNLYISDALNGYVWRIDATSKTMYVVAGGGTTICATGDATGNGCPARQATFAAGGTNFAVAADPGIAGIYAETSGSLLAVETATAAANPAIGDLRKIASGTQFGTINNSHPVNTLDVHFDVGDTFSSSVSAATITAGASNFTVGSFSAANCTVNSDNTTDCLLTLQANPTTVGAFTGTLQITSALGKVGTYALSGTLINTVSPTSIKVSLAYGGCPVTTATGDVLTTTISAVVTPQFSYPPTGAVNFMVNGTQVGTSNLNSAGIASFNYTFPVGTSYSVTAKYVGDSNFSASPLSAASVISSSNPGFTMTTASTPLQPIVAGGSALYSFAIRSTAYSGTISFSCSGLPAGAACVFYPGDSTLPSNTITVTPCGTPNVALSITTTPNLPVIYGIGAYGKGKWAVLGMLPALLLAMAVMIRRRKSPLRYTAVLLAFAFLIAMAGTVGCGNDFGPTSHTGTPSGTYSITVSAVTSSGLTPIVTTGSPPAPITLTIN